VNDEGVGDEGSVEGGVVGEDEASGEGVGDEDGSGMGEEEEGSGKGGCIEGEEEGSGEKCKDNGDNPIAGVANETSIKSSIVRSIVLHHSTGQTSSSLNA